MINSRKIKAPVLTGTRVTTQPTPTESPELLCLVEYAYPQTSAEKRGV